MTKRSFIVHPALGALMAVWIAGQAAAATTPKPPSFHVEITGHGKPMILIPGFASSGKTWDSTVAHYKDQYECRVRRFIEGFDPWANGGFLVRLKGGFEVEMSRRQAQKFKEVTSL